MESKRRWTWPVMLFLMINCGYLVFFILKLARQQPVPDESKETLARSSTLANNLAQPLQPQLRGFKRSTSSELIKPLPWELDLSYVTNRSLAHLTHSSPSAGTLPHMMVEEQC